MQKLNVHLPYGKQIGRLRRILNGLIIPTGLVQFEDLPEFGISDSWNEAQYAAQTIRTIDVPIPFTTTGVVTVTLTSLVYATFSGIPAEGRVEFSLEYSLTTAIPLQFFSRSYVVPVTGQPLTIFDSVTFSIVPTPAQVLAGIVTISVLPTPVAFDVLELSAFTAAVSANGVAIYNN